MIEPPRPVPEIKVVPDAIGQGMWRVEVPDADGDGGVAVACFGGCDGAEARARAYAEWLRAQFAGEHPEAVSLLLDLIHDCQMVLSDYLRPDGISGDQAIDGLLGLLDGPQWRAAEEAVGIVDPDGASSR